MAGHVLSGHSQVVINLADKIIRKKFHLASFAHLQAEWLPIPAGQCGASGAIAAIDESVNAAS